MGEPSRFTSARLFLAGQEKEQIRRTDVEREVDRSVLTDVLERHLDDLADPVLVDVVHREALDVCMAPEPSASEKASPERERETGAHCSPSGSSSRPRQCRATRCRPTGSTSRPVRSTQTRGSLPCSCPASPSGTRRGNRAGSQRES